MVGLARAYADQLAQSQQHFEHLSTTLPHNTDIRQELANVYRWRGWIDRALSEYAQVLAVEPGLISARVGNAHTQLDNRDYASVEQELVYLQESYPFEPAITDLEKRWDIHNQQEMTVDASTGRSSGETFGEDQYQIDAAWYSLGLTTPTQSFLRAVCTVSALAPAPNTATNAGSRPHSFPPIVAAAASVCEVQSTTASMTTSRLADGWRPTATRCRFAVNERELAATSLD
jgi:hypothetical protein